MLRVRLLFAPPPRRSFDDIGFHRFRPLLFIYTRSFFSRDDDDDDGKMMCSPPTCRPFFPPPRRQKSAQSIYARRFSPHPFTSLLLANKKRESKFRRQKRGVARNRRTRERDAVAFDVFLSVVRVSRVFVWCSQSAKQIKKRSSVVAFIFPFFFVPFFPFFLVFSMERERKGWCLRCHGLNTLLL